MLAQQSTKTSDPHLGGALQPTPVQALRKQPNRQLLLVKLVERQAVLLRRAILLLQNAEDGLLKLSLPRREKADHLSPNCRLNLWNMLRAPNVPLSSTIRHSSSAPRTPAAKWMINASEGRSSVRRHGRRSDEKRSSETARRDVTCSFTCFRSLEMLPETSIMIDCCYHGRVGRLHVTVSLYGQAQAVTCDASVNTAGQMKTRCNRDRYDD